MQFDQYLKLESTLAAILTYVIMHIVGICKSG